MEEENVKVVIMLLTLAMFAKDLLLDLMYNLLTEEKFTRNVLLLKDALDAKVKLLVITLKLWESIIIRIAFLVLLARFLLVDNNLLNMMEVLIA